MGRHFLFVLVLFLRSCEWAPGQTQSKSGSQGIVNPVTQPGAVCLSHPSAVYTVAPCLVINAQVNVQLQITTSCMVFLPARTTGFGTPMRNGYRYCIFRTVSGECCVFPFVFEKMSYDSCIGTVRNNGRAWCATTANYDRDFKWGNCEQWTAFPSDCGISRLPRAPPRGLDARRVRRVVGGEQAVQGAWPWQVSLFYKGAHYCGGSLVHRNWILTAAHCFNPYTSTNATDWTVKLGDHNILTREPHEQLRRISSIILHPRYKSMWFEGIYDTPPTNDVAVLRLKKPAVFNRNVQPVCLLRPGIEFPPKEVCYVVGWGHTEWNGTQPEVVHQARVRLVSHRVCNMERSYNGTIHDTALCAGYPEGLVDSCEYDSGGPLLCKKCGRFYVVGLVSWGDKCARPHKYGVYANMKKLTRWVKDNIRYHEILNARLRV